MGGGMPAELFEHINGLLTFLGLCFLAICIRYFTIEVLKNGFRRMRLQASIAISVTIFGEVIVRGWVWYLRHLQNAGIDTTFLTGMPSMMVPIVGTLIEAFGMLCMIRVFAPDKWGDYAWLACGAIAVILTGVMAWV